MIALLLAMSVTAAAPPVAAAPDRPLVFRNRLNFVPSACRAGVTTASDAGPATLLRPRPAEGQQGNRHQSLGERLLRAADRQLRGGR